MNGGCIVIKYATALLKGRWCILKLARCLVRKLPQSVSV